MNNNRWKDVYYDFRSPSVIDESRMIYFSNVADRNGSGTRTIPRSSSVSFTVGTDSIAFNKVACFGAGTHGRNILNSMNKVVGQGMYSTFLSFQINGGAAPNYTVSIWDCTLNQDFTNTSNTASITIYKCRLFTEGITVAFNTYNSIIYTFKYNYNVAANNSFIGCNGGTNYYFKSNLSTFEGCELALTKTDIETTYKNNYLAFSNNKFKIGAETTYTALTGTTDADRRTNFVARCTAQGITPPTFTEYGETNTPMGRWLFTDEKSIVEGQVIKGSTLAAWQLVRGIYLGYSSTLVDRLPITTAKNIPSSFAPSNPLDKVDVADNSIKPINQFDLLSPDTGRISSKIILIGDGVRQLNMLTVANNFPAQFGIMLDSSPNIGKDLPIIPSQMPIYIVPNNNYVVRSSNGNFASFKYKGTLYSTSLVTRNNIFRTSQPVIATDITEVVDNPVLYIVDDLAIQNTVRMRIVRELPAPLITSGNLQADYWYLVEANNAGDTGTVTYNDGTGAVVHPVGDSFLVKAGNLTFTISGNVHLRRCWRQDYTVASEVTDSAHWADRQKPLWFDVLPNDLRALNRYNLASDIEMKMDAYDNYIASGHPDFYPSISGNNGTLLPSYPITGVYMQIELLITSMNPM